MMYLIDTDWVIDYLDGDEDVVKRVKHLLPRGIGISVVSLAELYEGVHIQGIRWPARVFSGYFWMTSI